MDQQTILKGGGRRGSATGNNTIHLSSLGSWILSNEHHFELSRCIL